VVFSGASLSALQVAPQHQRRSQGLREQGFPSGQVDFLESGKNLFETKAVSYV